MDSILGQPIDKAFTIVHQLRLALQVASAVLKFHSTPWLNEYWSARDLYFFQGIDCRDLSASLRTLHLSIDVVNEQKPEHVEACPFSGIDVSMSGTSMPSMPGPIEEAKITYGIRNMCLYSLGVVLLAIGRWRCVDLGNVTEVRRLADEPCHLGPRYRELTQKVLDCDFGLGKDLKRPMLQKAVYENVLLELGSMIEHLDLSE